MNLLATWERYSPAKDIRLIASVVIYQSVEIFMLEHIVQGFWENIN